MRPHDPRQPDTCGTGAAAAARERGHRQPRRDFPGAPIRQAVPACPGGDRAVPSRSVTNVIVPVRARPGRRADAPLPAIGSAASCRCLVAVFEARHPGCQVTLQGVPLTEPYVALRAGEIDVLIHWLIVDEPDLTPRPGHRPPRPGGRCRRQPPARQAADGQRGGSRRAAGRPAADGLPGRVVGDARAGEHARRQANPANPRHPQPPRDLGAGGPRADRPPHRGIHRPAAAPRRHRPGPDHRPAAGPARPDLAQRLHSARIRALATTARSIYPAKHPNPRSRPAAPPHEIARPGRAITG
jgi:hypothetical protein